MTFERVCSSCQDGRHDQCFGYIGQICDCMDSAHNRDVGPVVKPEPPAIYFCSGCANDKHDECLGTFTIGNKTMQCACINMAHTVIDAALISRVQSLPKTTLGEEFMQQVTQGSVCGDCQHGKHDQCTGIINLGTGVRGFKTCKCPEESHRKRTTLAQQLNADPTMSAGHANDAGKLAEYAKKHAKWEGRQPTNTELRLFVLNMPLDVQLAWFAMSLQHSAQAMECFVNGHGGLVGEVQRLHKEVVDANDVARKLGQELDKRRVKTASIPRKRAPRPACDECGVSWTDCRTEVKNLGHECCPSCRHGSGVITSSAGQLPEPPCNACGKPWNMCGNEVRTSGRACCGRCNHGPVSRDTTKPANFRTEVLPTPIDASLLQRPVAKTAACTSCGETWDGCMRSGIIDRERCCNGCHHPIVET